MKRYSSKQAKKGKVAYRTPHRFHFQQHQKILRNKIFGFPRLGKQRAKGER